MLRHAVRSLLAVSLSLTALLSAGCSKPQRPAVTPDPFRVAPVPTGWQVIGPGGGGSTFIPAFSPTDPSRILIRCDMTGSYITRDNGESWQMLNFPGGVGAFAFDPNKPEDVYVGSRGLYRSRDGGANWEILFPALSAVKAIEHHDDHADIHLMTSDNFPGGEVVSILVDPQTAGKIYCAISGGRGGESGLYVSQDDGATWSEGAKFDSPVLALFQNPADPGRVVVFCRRSWNAWDKTSGQVETRPHPEGMSAVTSVSGGVDPDKPGVFRLWAVSIPGRLGERLPGKVFVSEDAAVSWQEVTSNVIAGNPLSDPAKAPSFTWIGSCLADSRSAYLVCSRYIQNNENGQPGFYYGIFRTSDAGKSWHWVYRSGGGSGQYGVSDGKEADNIQDSWVHEAFASDFVLAICASVSPVNPERAIFTDWYRSMKTEDGGGTWTALYAKNLPDSTVVSRGQDVTTCYGVHFDPFDPQHIAISYTDIGYFHSFNSGKSWRRSVNGIPREWENTCYWMEFDPTVQGRMWSVWSSWHDIPRFKMIRNRGWQENTVGGVAVSQDAGRTWQVSNNGLPEQSPTTCLALDPSSPAGARVLYATVYGQGVYKSTDDGASWVQKNNGLGQDLNVWQIKLVDSRTLYLVATPSLTYGDSGNVLVNGALYRSDDSGESWKKIALPDGVRFPNSIEFDPSRPERLYLACWADLDPGDFGGARDQGLIENQGGVLLSEDGGATWNQIYDPKAYVYAVTVDPSKPGRVYLVTFHNGAFRSDDQGATWGRIDGYNFYWGHRVVLDPQDASQIYITTFGGSVFHGAPTVNGK